MGADQSEFQYIEVPERDKTKILPKENLTYPKRNKSKSNLRNTERKTAQILTKESTEDKAKVTNKTPRKHQAWSDCHRLMYSYIVIMWKHA